MDTLKMKCELSSGRTVRFAGAKARLDFETDTAADASDFEVGKSYEVSISEISDETTETSSESKAGLAD